MRNWMTLLVSILLSVYASAQVHMVISGIAPPGVDSVSVMDMARGVTIARIGASGGVFSATLALRENHVYGVGTRSYHIPFFADSTAVVADLVGHTLRGSLLNELTGKCDYSLDSLDLALAERARQLTALADGDEAEARRMVADLRLRRIPLRCDILRRYAGTFVPAVYLPDMVMGMQLHQIEPWLKEDAPYMQHPRMNMVKRVAEGMRKKQPGRMFADLTMDDMDGQQRQLSEWCGKGTYVLVDFWASWCGPCRMEMPYVVDSYVKYHSKGYEVVGVSFDSNAPAWKSAVKRLGMTWPQISDLKGWGSAASDAYGVMSIPSNVLLDPEGRIIDSDLRGERLLTRLSEIYGY